MPDKRDDGEGILKTALGLGLLGTGQTQEHIQYSPSTPRDWLTD